MDKLRFVQFIGDTFKYRPYIQLHQSSGAPHVSVDQLPDFVNLLRLRQRSEIL